MKGIIENLQFLIPIALLIVFRIVKAKSEDSKKQQKSSSGGLGELVKKIQEAQNNPDYSKALTRDTEVYIPPKSFEAKPVQKPKPVRPPAKTKKVNKVNKPLPKALLEEQKEPIQTVAVRSATETPKPVQSGFSLQNLTPLQQAVVWSEILGQPKSLFQN